MAGPSCRAPQSRVLKSGVPEVCVRGLAAANTDGVTLCCRERIVIRIRGEQSYGNRIVILCADGRQEFAPPLSCHAVADADFESLILKTSA